MKELREVINPFFMYGTAWKEEETEKLTLMALESGFRAIDTANQRKHYYEEGVGNALTSFIQSEGYKREELFLQTKFTYKEGQDNRLPYDPKASNSDQVKQSFESSLDHLNTDYLDSYVLHGPSTREGLSDKDYEVWEAMESIQKDGLTKYLGVSNIDANQLRLLLDKCKIKPSFVQNRCYAHVGWDKEVRTICNDNNIIYQGFSLLTVNRNYLSDLKIKRISNKYDIPIPSIAFRFAKQIGMLPLTGTSNELHMKEDLIALEGELTAEEIEFIENIAKSS